MNSSEALHLTSNATLKHSERRPQRGICYTLRLLFLLACTLGIFFCWPQTASAADTGHISGQLLNGSKHNAPVANQSVTLQMAQGNNSIDKITLNTDSQGNYAFSALQSDSTVQYAIYTLYQGAQYYTDLIDLSKNANQQINLTVYDATTSTTDIAVVQTTILVAKPNVQSGMLTLSEDFFFENLSTRTYVGNLDASNGKPNALLFTLPAGARFLTLGSSFNGYKSIQVETGFASNAAVLPGTSRFSFSFQVPYSGTSYNFAYQAVYPTVLLTLFTPLDILTTSQTLTSKGPSNTQSGTFQSFEVQTLSAGKNIKAQLAGLPAPAQATPGQSPVNPALLWLVALLILLMALAGIGGYFYNTRRSKAAQVLKEVGAQPKGAAQAISKKGTAIARKDALYQELLELDRAYQSGRLKRTTYQEQRARLKARLRDIVREQPAKPTRVASKGEK